MFFPVLNGKRTTRKLGALMELNQEQANRKAEEMLRSLKLRAERKSPTVLWVVEQYRIEKMPRLRHSTQRVTELWIKKYVLAHWGLKPITDLQPRPVELWLESLPLAPKTRGHLRELLHRLVDYAMWCGSIPVGTNPISLVTVRGSTTTGTWSLRCPHSRNDPTSTDLSRQPIGHQSDEGLLAPVIAQRQPRQKGPYK